MIDKILKYETTELKLGALIMATIPGTSFKIHDRANSTRKTIEISYPIEYLKTLRTLEKDYLNKEASCNTFLYNEAMNQLRNALRIGEDL